MSTRGFTIAAALSFVLGASAMILWWRSGRGCDELVAPARYGDRWLVTSEFGVLVFEWQSLQTLGPGDPQPDWVFFCDTLPRRYPGNWRWLGFDAYRANTQHYRRLPPVPTRGVVVPHWAVVLAAGVLPAWWLRGARQRAAGRRRLRHGLCPTCGYDLRATPGRCPECGTAVPPGQVSRDAPALIG